MSNIILEIKNLQLNYGKTCAFNDANLTIEKNKVTSIIGPSGCGKSSLLQCINRMAELNQEVSISGDIVFNDQSVYDSRIDLRQLRKRIGIVFQEPTPLPLSIATNIELPLKEHGFDNIKERTESALKAVGLWNEVKNKLNSPAGKLSGGQKQRLCLARTIALEPEIILMDEPCSSLDPKSTEVIEGLIKDLKNKYTIVIITHNLSQAKRVSDQTAVFWFDENACAGRIIESRETEYIFNHSQNTIVNDYIAGLKG